MMSKLGVLLTICLLLFPVTALPMDGDQPADRLVERMQDNISSEQHPFFEKRRGGCCTPPRKCKDRACKPARCCGPG
uniref:M superfamily MMSK group conopeptide Mr+R3-KPAR01 n=1 Tax=Conus marmoreus TaxID=42752 RepID=H2BKK6_CONMR|nr:M superfamily MMSK group conopeptide Mr+R3-KPAR01 [Conus marmoreus]